MAYRCLATDYDGTLAESGRVSPATSTAIERLARGGFKTVMVTGRLLSDIHRVFPEVARFDRIVAENGAVVADPRSGQSRVISPPRPPELVGLLRERGIHGMEIGEVIVGTYVEHEAIVREVIAKIGAPLDIILNKHSLMILPCGIDKATGLTAALAEIGIPPAETVAVGDAENDAPLLAACGFRVAVANALPGLKAEADWVTRGEAGQGIVELVERLLAEG
ncbi:MAG TPA: HAD family hydrolase [Pirellulales bacterium]|nr:HAD family hydrolase [Pirellulales bacterium]